MSRGEFEDLIFLEIRGLFPELLTWEDAVRWLRWRGTPMQSVDGFDDYHAMLDPIIEQAFLRYASTTGAFRTDAKFIFPANTESYPIGTNEVPVFAPEIAGWSEPGDNSPRWELEKVPSVPSGTFGVPFSRFGWMPWFPVPPVRTAMFYLLVGNQLRIFPVPERDIKIYLFGKARPYFDSNNNLVGVAPEHANLLARYIASYLIEPFQPERAVMWREEALAEWNKYAQRQSWEELKARRAGHNIRTNRLIWWRR